VLRSARRAKCTQSSDLVIRQSKVAGDDLDSDMRCFSEASQRHFRSASEPSDLALMIPAASLPKFIAAPDQSEEEKRKFAVLRLIAPTEPRTSQRRQAIQEASRHHAVPGRTIERWVKRQTIEHRRLQHRKLAA